MVKLEKIRGWCASVVDVKNISINYVKILILVVGFQFFVGVAWSLISVVSF